MSSDTLALFNRTQERKVDKKDGAYVAEVLNRAVVVERRLVGRVGRVGRVSRWGSQPLCNHLM